MSEPEKDPVREQTGSQLSETTIEVPVTVETGLPKVSESLPTLELDTILAEEIGAIGKYQLQSLVVGGILVIFSVFTGLNYVFTTAPIPTRCLIPECESEPAEFAPAWVMNAIPPGRKGPFDNCHRYGRAAPAAPRLNGTCPASLFDRSKRLPCDKYVHENTHSVVIDFGLECQEWRRSMIGMSRQMGTLTALPITSYMSDRFGRRIAITFNAFNSAWIGLNRYWIHNYIGFVILELAEATFGSGLFSCVYILMLELIIPKYRVAAGATLNTAFAVGQMLLGAIAWCVPHWRQLTLALYIPQLTTIFSYCLISESVRWYMSKGRLEESDTLLKKMARVNGRSVSDSSLAALRRTAQDKMIREAREAARRGDEPGLFTQVWRHKRVLLRVLVSPVWWITATFIYYGLTVNAVNMSGNKYINYITVAAVDIPGFWMAYFLLNKIGRKPVLTGGFWICGACQIIYIFIPQGLFAVSLPVYLIAKCTSAMVMTSVYVYTAELYPTNNRHKLLAVSSMCGRLGAILAPLTPAFAAQWFVELPFVLFSSMALLSGILIFFTPETLGTVLPDTFEQAEQLGLKV